MNLTFQMDELRVHHMDAVDKKGPLVEDRANVWCTNYKRYKHMRPKCPSFQSLAVSVDIVVEIMILVHVSK